MLNHPPPHRQKSLLPSGQSNPRPGLDGLRNAGFTSNTKSALTIETKAPVLWQLKANGRILRSPHGRTLPLTYLESRFLRRIAASEDYLLRRDSKHQVSHVQSPITEIGNLEVLVSRLRRKAQYLGIDLPLVTIRGCGYLFTEPLRISTIEIPP